MKVGSTSLTMRSTMRSSHGDTDVTTTTTIAGTSSTTQTITIGDDVYERVDTGPWLPTEASSSDDGSFKLNELAEGAFVDRGVETRAGRTVHRLVLRPRAVDLAKMVLRGFPRATAVEGEVVFFCAEDGLPIAATIDVTWTQPQGGATVDAEMSMALEFRSLGGTLTIKRPEHVWQRFSSTRHGFAIAYPDEWSYARNGAWDEFDAPWPAFVLIQAVGTEGMGLNPLARAELTALKEEFDTEAGTNKATTLGGVAARILTVTGWSDSVGAKVNVFEVVAVNDVHVWYVAWVSEVGQETIDRQWFDQMLSTFEFELLRMG